MKPKLLYIITQPVVGGAQKYVFDLARHFNGHGYEVSVACGGEAEGDLFKKLSAHKIRTHHLKFLAREIKFGDDVLAFFELLKLFKQERPDIIHLNSSKVGLVGALAAFFCKLITNNYQLKTVFTAHGWIFKEDLSHLTRQVAVFVSWLSAKFQDKIICVSQDDFNQALKHRIAPPRKLCVIHNAAAEPRFLARKKAREEISAIISRPLSDSSFVLTNLGRLYATKGLNYLIEAVKEAKNGLRVSGSVFHDLCLVIFGDGPERETLNLQLTTNNLQHSVFLVGDVPDAARHLKGFDAMVLSSVKEGFPYAILEAGLAGLPVIATAVGGIGEVIKNGETGLLIEPKNSQAIAEAILKLAVDSDLVRKLSLNLKKTIMNNFGFETMIQKTEWVYKV